MVEVDLALIGGTGIGPRLEAFGGQALAVPTPFGAMRGRVFQNNGIRFLAVQRHSAGHKTPPHLVNYRAIAAGLKAVRAKACFASAAVGCLRPEWAVGSLALCTGMVDLSGRNATLFDQKVEHTPITDPFPAHGLLAAAAEELSIDIHQPAVYVNNPGPRYETPQEIHFARIIGGDIVGMTAGTEAVVMREAGVPYGVVALVTNHAAGMPGAILDHNDVVQVMEQGGEQVVSLMIGAARYLG